MVQHGKTPYRMHISVVVNVKEIEGNVETLAKDKRQRIESRHTDNW